MGITQLAIICELVLQNVVRNEMDVFASNVVRGDMLSGKAKIKPVVPISTVTKLALIIHIATAKRTGKHDHHDQVKC